MQLLHTLIENALKCMHGIYGYIWVEQNYYSYTRQMMISFRQSTKPIPLPTGVLFLHGYDY